MDDDEYDPPNMLGIAVKVPLFTSLRNTKSVRPHAFHIKSSSIHLPIPKRL